jgi:uncharacterized membrane protein YesL
MLRPCNHYQHKTKLLFGIIIMSDAFGVWRRALRHLNHYGYRYVWANLAWFVLSLPLITAPAAWMGLIRMSHDLHTGKTSGLNEFWETFKQQLGRSVVMFVLNVLVIGINVSNLLSYRGIDNTFYAVLRTVWLCVLVVWIVAQFYLYPILLEMEKPNLLQGFRNALVMMILNPLFTLGIMLGVIALLVLSSLFIVIWGLLTGSLLAIVATSAVLDRLIRAGIRHPLPQASDEPEINEVDIT